MQDGTGIAERSGSVSELMSLALTSAERLKTVVETTHEIKEQLLIMNGRVRQNEKDIAAIKANPPQTVEDRDEQRKVQDTERSKLEERVRELEGRLPSIIQTIVIALLTGGSLALASHLLSKIL